MNRKGQGTIEYLIIIAIVVVIALVVVGLLTGFFQTGTSVNTTQQQIRQKTQNIALADSLVNEEGEYYLEISLNQQDPITITNISIGDINSNFNTNNIISLGTQKLFIIPTGDICTLGTNKTVKEIKITYTKKGVTQTQIYSNISIPCQNYQITQTTDLATNNANVCTENNWSYSDGECQVGGTLTRTWTKIGQCEGGVTKSTTEEVECEYQTTTYTLTIEINGEGSVTVDDEEYTQTLEFSGGTTIVLNATPESSWIFDNWSGELSSTNTQETITINTNRTITATFIEDDQAPEIDIYYPNGDEEIIDAEIEFFFEVNDNSNNSTCTLIIEGEEIETLEDLTNGGQYIYYTPELGEGTFEYYYECTDASSNSTTSDTATFSLVEIDLTESLIGYWPLDETTGTTAFDYSGNEFNGEIKSAVTINQSGIVDKSYLFANSNNPSTNSVYLPIESEFAPNNNDKTISLWFKSSDIDSVSTHPGKGLYMAGAYDDHGTQIISLSKDFGLGAGEIKILVLNIHRTSLYSEIINYTNNEWGHIVVTQEYISESSSNTKIYYNGELVGEGNQNFGGDFDMHRIGCDSRHLLCAKNETIDEVAIWDKVLSSQEISAVYNNGNGQNLVE